MISSSFSICASPTISAVLDDFDQLLIYKRQDSDTISMAQEDQKPMESNSRNGGQDMELAVQTEDNQK